MKIGIIISLQMNLEIEIEIEIGIETESKVCVQCACVLINERARIYKFTYASYIHLSMQCLQLFFFLTSIYRLDQINRCQLYNGNAHNGSIPTLAIIYSYFYT